MHLSRPTAHLSCVGVALALAAPAAATPKQQPAAPRTPPVVVHASDGFHWGDAAIGAAAGVGAAIAAMGGITLARAR